MKQNIIIVLLGALILIQLANTKHSHDNSYRLSHIVKNTNDTASVLSSIIRDEVQTNN